MSSPTVQVEGAAELARLLRQIGDAGLKKANRLAYKAGAEIVAREAQSRAPRRSGRLASSVKATAGQTGGAVVGNATYTAAIHWGRKTGNVGSPPGNHPGRNVIQGRPFITDAADSKVDEVTNVYFNEVMNLFNQMGGAHGA